MRSLKNYSADIYEEVLGRIDFPNYNILKILMTLKSNLFLYADDSCLAFQGKDIIEIEKELNEDFTNICEWFVDDRLSFHFGED